MYIQKRTPYMSFDVHNLIVYGKKVGQSENEGIEVQ